MKKVWNFLRSMRFGMILLVLVSLVSFAGSIIPQNNEAMWYVNNYPNTHQWIFRLGADHLFSTWYFVAMVALLCGNLLLCSIVRIGKVRKAAAEQVRRASHMPTAVELPTEQLEKLQHHLQSAHYQANEVEEGTVWTKNHLGFYGSFLTHLGILLIFVVGGIVLSCTTNQDQSIYPGESYVLKDGTEVSVIDFRIEDETGRLDFTSHIQVTAPNGSGGDVAEISVNHPYSFRNHKFYQQTYGTCGSITVQDASGAEDTFMVDEVCFLSADGVTGVWYEALYPGYVRDEAGNFTLITSTAGAYTDPLYQVLVCGEDGRSPVLAMPGESITVNDLTFTFNDPVSYPGIRIKTLPSAIIGALYFAFALLIAALWLTFFHVPVAVVVREEGYALFGAKTTGTALEIAGILGDEYAILPTAAEEKSDGDRPEQEES